MNDMEENWQDPLLDVSIPYKSLAPLALSCYQLDEDLQDLISFFSTLSKEESACHINETSFESSLRVLKDVLLIPTQKSLENNHVIISKNSGDSGTLGKESFSKMTDLRLKNQLNESNIIDNKVDSCETNINKLIFENGTRVDPNIHVDSVISNIINNDEMVPRNDFSTKIINTAIENKLNEDDSKLLIAFFRELEAAKLFENLESFSGILTAHSIHLRIVQDIVNDIFRVDELRLRLCSQLAALINPIILSRLESYNNSLFCNAFTIPSNSNSELETQNSSLPNPRLYQWPSNSTCIDEYKSYMSKLPLLCFSETCDLGSCIMKSFEAYNLKCLQRRRMLKNSEKNALKMEYSVRVRSLDFIFNEDGFINHLDHPLFIVDGNIDNTHNNSFHLPLCMDIAQDSKDIERDVLYVNGREYNGATGGYEKIIYVVANLIENYWLNNFKKTENDPNNLDFLNKDESNINYTVELCNKTMSNYIDYDKGEKYEDRNTDSVIISIILLHIMSRTYSGGACFDKVSLLYSKSDCIVISPYSKRARPLEVVILPNIALMLSTLRFRLYEVMDSLSVNTLPCYLVDTHVVSRLIPNLEFIEALPLYSFHILSRTPINKIPESIFSHLVRSANLFISSHILFIKIKMDNDSDSFNEQDQFHSDQQGITEPNMCENSINIDCPEIRFNAGSEILDINLNGSIVSELNITSKCLDTERIIEVTGDDLTMITPGEAALFKMFTNIQDKDGLNSSIENINLSNSDTSTNKEILDDQEETSIHLEEFNKNCGTLFHKNQELRRKNSATNFFYSSLESKFKNDNCSSEDQIVDVGTEDQHEIKDKTHTNTAQTLTINNSNELNSSGDNKKNSFDNFPDNRTLKINELESRENSGQNSVVLSTENNLNNSRRIPKLHFGEDIKISCRCILNSNIYIASSENSTHLANDLCNLPTDSIGAIDQENQQHALFLQSKRVISQFGIFNNIINT